MGLGEFFDVKLKKKNKCVDVSHASGKVREESTIKYNNKSNVQSC